MAQRNSSTSGRPGAAKASGKTGGARPVTTTKPGGKPGSKPTAGRPPARKPGKSIVNQKQTPWGLIATTAVVVLFAVVVVLVVVFTGKDSSKTTGAATKGGQTVNAADPYRQPELAAASKIPGLTYRVEGEHNHATGNISYDSSPPVGGNHNGFWADCSGTVYSKAIANENAVHMLEHGGIWITYNAKTLPASQLTVLKSYVNGVNGLALSPYPNLKTPVSLQAWGYQLFVDKATDPRVQQFISLLKFNKKTTPEYGASCSNPGFKDHPSTFGHPTDS